MNLLERLLVRVSITSPTQNNSLQSLRMARFDSKRITPASYAELN
jgi:hypothetical protein